MNQITQEIYSQSKVVTTYNTWELALKAYNELNQSFVKSNWTRHNSCEEEVGLQIKNNYVKKNITLSIF